MEIAEAIADLLIQELSKWGLSIRVKNPQEPICLLVRDRNGLYLGNIWILDGVCDCCTSIKLPNYLVVDFGDPDLLEKVAEVFKESDSIYQKWESSHEQE